MLLALEVRVRYGSPVEIPWPEASLVPAIQSLCPESGQSHDSILGRYEVGEESREPPSLGDDDDEVW